MNRFAKPSPKNTCLLIISLFIGTVSIQAQKINRVEPLSWWTEMKTPLRLMFYGENLANAQVSVKEAGISVTGTANAENPNYLFVDVDVQKAGNYTFILQKGKKKLKYNYVINERRNGSASRTSFTSADVIYLLMPDRFANGDTSNDSTASTLEPANRASLSSRHGGDIQGIIDHLDYIAELGATAVWSTPLLLDNEPDYTYHGYACGDYYHIDPRYGSNELYQTMVQECHKRNLKVIMDIVTNHCGLAHWWIKDLPYQDWIHQFSTYTTTNNAFTTNYDLNASKYDLHIQESGWFDTHMPDMNLDNPELLRYFTQWAIWWVEYADLDGLRVDTYPYNEKMPMSEWCQNILTEYPNLNIVGECWTRPAANVAYWEANARNTDGFNSHLPSVMDFPTEEAIRQALADDGTAWGAGLARVYDAVSQDYLYTDARRLLLFIGNHDMDRIGDMVKDNNPERVKLAIAMLATMRGVPQLFYGDEIGMRSADMSQGHSGLRKDFPGGWPTDSQNAFDAAQRTAEQKDMFDYHKALFNWRKQEPIIHNGRTMHFISRDNTYAYFRYTEQGAVFVFINAAEDTREIPWAHYAEMLNSYVPVGKNVLTGEIIDTKQPYTAGPLSALILKLEVPK